MKKSDRKHKRKKKKSLTSLSSETTLALLKGEKKSRLIKESNPSPEYKPKKLIPDFGAYYQQNLDENKPCIFMLMNDEDSNGTVWQRNKYNEFGSLTTKVEMFSKRKDPIYKATLFESEKYLATIEFKDKMVQAFEEGLSTITKDMSKAIVFLATPNFSASYVTSMGEKVLPFLGSNVCIMEEDSLNENISVHLDYEIDEIECLLETYL
ncbi:hypothetical protein [Crocosphaera chwakensis]|uniref:Uncharacterized protein n=1 Tax=Crocosphaera chwakensis CCY0110 TaxID=391612 RepID=A3IXT7_9CHRO|nr:hypothetical protein [Crocosphaera chwakensis]EAZ88695.1 hypothetical protein CY0110_14220 [Crocosphaera chwakensis CCY0110]